MIMIFKKTVWLFLFLSICTLTGIGQIKNDYAALKELLSQGGNASAKAAVAIVRFLTPTVT